MKINVKKLSSVFISAFITTVICLSVPITQASDATLYQNAVSGNVTLMLTLDRSDSMSVTGLTGGFSCDIPDSYTVEPYTTQNLVATSGQVKTYSDSNGYQVYRDVPNPPINPDEKDYTKIRYDNRFTYAEDLPNRDFGRAYCRAKAPNIKFRAYYVYRIAQYRYDICSPKAGSTSTQNFIDKYEDCDFNQKRNLTKEQLNAILPNAITTGLVSTPYNYRYVNGTYYPPIYYFYETTANYVRFYDRLTKMKDALYQLLLGQDKYKIDDEKYIGLSVFPYDPGDATTTQRGYIAAPAKRLGDNNGQVRIDLMNVVAALRPKVNTPTPAVYGEVAAYLMGTNTRRQLAKNVILAQRVTWNACYGLRDGDGKCISGDFRPIGDLNFINNKGWSTNGWETGWLSRFSGIYFPYYDLATKAWNIQESSEESSPSDYGFGNNDLPTNSADPNAWYAQNRVFPKYAMFESNDPAVAPNDLPATRKWRKCNSWDNIGQCTAWGDAFSTTSSPYQPTDDPRLILKSTLTADEKKIAYSEISYTQKCSAATFTGVGNLTCYGATNRIATHIIQTTNDWISSCSNKTYDEPLYRFYNRCGSTSKWGARDAALATAGITADQLNSDATISKEPCRVATKDNFGNTSGYYPALCYIKSSSTYVANPYETGTYSNYSGFNDSVDSSKVPSAGSYDGLNANYLQPDSITQNLSTQQCGAQGIYFLTDGEPLGGTDPTILKNLYISALSGSNNPNGANFNCASNPNFGSVNTWSGCMANLSKSLLRENGATSNLDRPIKTATVGYGRDFQKIPSFNRYLSTEENAANIRDISVTEVNDNKKNIALLGVYGKGGWYSATSMVDIIISIKNLLNDLSIEIAPINTGTVTIPQNAINESALVDAAFYPEFQPTPDFAVPLWLGNVKRFKVVDGQLEDKSGNKLFDSVGNLIKNPVDEWSGGVSSNLPLRLNNSASTQRILYVNEALVTASDGTKTLQPFTNGPSDLLKIDNNYLGDNSSDDKSYYDGYLAYILSLLGYSGIDPAQPPGNIDPTVVKRSPELRQVGAVVHSSPLVISQSGRVNVVNGKVTSSESDDYVVFGTTQGLLHVVSATTGVEKYAFLPYEMLQNQPETMLEKGKSGASLDGVKFGIDAPWVAYSEYVQSTNGYITVGNGNNNKTGKQWLYGGLRMGGRSYYSLDLGNIEKPKLKFVISPDSAAANTPLSYMGQSWSKPTIGYVKWKGERKLVMFVGGGYDMGYEGSEYSSSNPDKGSGVYMFDADNGSLLWWTSANAADANVATGTNSSYAANMRYSIPSRISTLDRDSDGLIDQLYFGDLGGQVWRVDINNSLTNSTTDKTKAFAQHVIRLLNLHKDNGLSPRFYEAPSVATHEKRFVSVSIGSGNRSLPLKIYQGSNYDNSAVYVIFDKDVGGADLYNLDNTGLTTKDLILSDLKDLTNPNTLEANYTDKGWFVKLADSTTANYKQRYKVLGETIAINSKLYVPVFDDIPTSSLSSSTVCGGGVRGSTTIHLYCIPYGDPKCRVRPDGMVNTLYVGSGIYGINLGGGVSADDRQVIGGINCTGSTCLDKTDNTQKPSAVKVSNVVLRRLIPTSWSEKIAKPSN